ncbi:unnamed protein product, partial [Mesorhabditis belari]|uniref:Methyltransferase FkbM domain-containing protein n=1 Tax=Mesorhabditis belari TaxID=2138241 RepID=A0AAF3FNE8_9BILA
MNLRRTTHSTPFLVISCFLTATLVTIFWNIRLHSDVNELTKNAAIYRQCMMNDWHLENEQMTWSRGPEKALKRCLRFGPKLVEIRNTNDVKQVIPLKESSDKCTFVTLGVGQDVSAEQQVKTLMPSCQFFGADPIDEGNKEKYEELGTFFKYAVSGNDISKSQMLTKGNYTEIQTMTAVPLYKFLRESVKESVIDFLFVDTEYAEYAMFDLLQAGRAELNGFTFCQINIEIHRPLNHEQKLAVHTFVKRLIAEGSYIIAHDELPHENWHHRLFFYNHHSLACRRKFL